LFVGWLAGWLKIDKVLSGRGWAGLGVGEFPFLHLQFSNLTLHSRKTRIKTVDQAAEP